MRKYALARIAAYGQMDLLLACFCSLGIIFFWWWLVYSNDQYLTDSDLYYHLSIIRESAAQGLLHVIRQAPDIGWADYYLDKDFLFHQCLRFLYVFAGEAGVLLALKLSLLVSLLLLFWESVREGHRFFLGVLVLLSLTLFNAYFFYRFSLFRPFVWAAMLYSVLFIALLRRWAYTVFIFSALYILSYHTFYIPLFTFFIFFAVAAAGGRAAVAGLRRCLLAGLIGTVVGFLANPYFPTNILMGFTQLKIALNAIPEIRGLTSAELVQPDFFAFLQKFLVPLGLYIISMAAFIYKLCGRDRRAADFSINWQALALLSGAFWAIAFLQIRMMEYVLPVSVLFIGYTLNGCREWLAPKKRSRIFHAIAMLACAAAFAQSWEFMQQKAESTIYRKMYNNVFAAIRAIPLDPRRQKVFNCNWGDGSLLFYARPDLFFVDLLDPIMLYLESQEKFRMRQALNEGYFSSPGDILDKVFHADFVLCNGANLEKQLLDNAKFKVIFPEKPELYPWSAVKVFERLY